MLKKHSNYEIFLFIYCIKTLELENICLTLAQSFMGMIIFISKMCIGLKYVSITNVTRLTCIIHCHLTPKKVNKVPPPLPTPEIFGGKGVVTLCSPALGDTHP